MSDADAFRDDGTGGDALIADPVAAYVVYTDGSCKLKDECMVATESYLQSQEFRRLSQTIQSGECVLFLGAGVSLDSGAPDGQGLADELGQKFFDVPPALPIKSVVLEQLSALFVHSE